MTNVFPLRYFLKNYDSNNYYMNLDLFSLKTKSFYNFNLYFEKYLIIFSNDIDKTMKKIKYFFPTIEINIKISHSLFNYIHLKNKRKKILLNKKYFTMYIDKSNLTDLYKFIKQNIFFFNEIENIFLNKNLKFYFYCFCQENNIKNFYCFYQYNGKQLENENVFEYFIDVFCIKDNLLSKKLILPRIRFSIFNYVSVYVNKLNKSIFVTIFIFSVITKLNISKPIFNIEFIILCINKHLCSLNTIVLKRILLKFLKKKFNIKKKSIFIFIYNNEKKIFLNFQKTLKYCNTYFLITQNLKRFEKFLFSFIMKLDIKNLNNFLNKIQYWDLKNLIQKLKLDKLYPLIKIDKINLQTLFNCDQTFKNKFGIYNIVGLINSFSSNTYLIYKYILSNQVIQKVFQISNFFHTSIHSINDKTFNNLHSNLFIFEAYDNNFILNFKFLSNDTKSKIDFLNGGILLSTNGIFKNVAELDYKSFYPSIICEYNISYENVSIIDTFNESLENSKVIAIEEHKLSELKRTFPNFQQLNLIKQEKFILFDLSNKHLLLPTILNQSIKRRNFQRDRINKNNLNLCKIIKLQNNYIYGKFIKTLFSNNFNPITFLGRKILIDAVKKVNSLENFNVVKLETDSIFVSNISKDKIHCILNFIQKNFSFEKIILENKNYYSYMILTEKSRYCIIQNNNTYKIKITPNFNNSINKFKNKYIRYILRKNLNSILKYK